MAADAGSAQGTLAAEALRPSGEKQDGSNALSLFTAGAPRLPEFEQMLDVVFKLLESLSLKCGSLPTRGELANSTALLERTLVTKAEADLAACRHELRRELREKSGEVSAEIVEVSKTLRSELNLIAKQAQQCTVLNKEGDAVEEAMEICRAASVEQRLEAHGQLLRTAEDGWSEWRKTADSEREALKEQLRGVVEKSDEISSLREDLSALADVVSGIQKPLQDVMVEAAKASISVDKRMEKAERLRQNTVDELTDWREKADSEREELIRAVNENTDLISSFREELSSLAATVSQGETPQGHGHDSTALTSLQTSVAATWEAVETLQRTAKDEWTEWQTNANSERDAMKRQIREELRSLAATVSQGEKPQGDGHDSTTLASLQVSVDEAWEAVKKLQRTAKDEWAEWQTNADSEREAMKRQMTANSRNAAEVPLLREELSALANAVAQIEKPVKEEPVTLQDEFLRQDVKRLEDQMRTAIDDINASMASLMADLRDRKFAERRSTRRTIRDAQVCGAPGNDTADDEDEDEDEDENEAPVRASSAAEILEKLENEEQERDEVKNELVGVESTVAELKDTVTELSAKVDSRVGKIEDDLESTREGLERIQALLATVSNHEDLEALRSELGNEIVEAASDGLIGIREELDGAVASLQESCASKSELEEHAERQRQELFSLATQIARNLTDVESRVSAKLEGWQNTRRDL